MKKHNVVPSIFSKALDDEINELGIFHYSQLYIYLTEELKWIPNRGISGKIYWTVYNSLADKVDEDDW